jgi:hypothetical protein
MSIHAYVCACVMCVCVWVRVLALIASDTMGLANPTFLFAELLSWKMLDIFQLLKVVSIFVFYRVILQVPLLEESVVYHLLLFLVVKSTKKIRDCLQRKKTWLSPVGLEAGGAEGVLAPANLQPVR